MPRWMSFLVFFFVLLALAGSLHYYLWARLVRDPGLPGLTHTVLSWLFVGLGLSIPLGMLAFRLLPRESSAFLAWTTFIWMGVSFILVSVVFSTDLFRLMGGGLGQLLGWLGHGGLGQELEDPSRRQLIARGVAGAASATALGVSAVSVRSALADVEVPEVPVKLDRLPAALSGLTIAQLTDVHVGPTIGRRFIESVVEKANGTRPDIVVITGDLVDGSVEGLRSHLAPLGRLKARYGVYFVTGNHEYYSGADPWIEELRRMGITVLRNERVVIGDPGASLDLVGVDDYSAHRFGGGHGPDLAKALVGRDPERASVLLAHQPREVERASALGMGLQISGHTHGGQIWPFNHAVGLVQPYVSGLHRHSKDTQIYVSRGTGYWGPPMRLLAPAEVTKIILT
jgi:predicted MPP superfamily phosphohydrolase